MRSPVSPVPRRGRRPRRPGQTANGLKANKRRLNSCGMVGTSKKATAPKSCRPYAEGRQPDFPLLHADTSCTSYQRYSPLEAYRRRTSPGVWGEGCAGTSFPPCPPPSVFPAPFHAERGAAGGTYQKRTGHRKTVPGPSRFIVPPGNKPAPGWSAADSAPRKAPPSAGAPWNDFTSSAGVDPACGKVSLRSTLGRRWRGGSLPLAREHQPLAWHWPKPYRSSLK